MSIQVTYTPVTFGVQHPKLPTRKWEDVRVVLKDVNPALAIGLRRVAFKYVEVPILHIDIDGIDTTDDLVYKLAYDIRTKISQVKLQHTISPAAKFRIKKHNTTDHEITVTTADITADREADNIELAKIPKGVQLFTLSRNGYINLPITVKVIDGEQDNSAIFTRSCTYRDLNYVDVYELNYTGNYTLIRVEITALEKLLADTKHFNVTYNVTYNKKMGLTGKPRILLISNPEYLAKISRTQLDTYTPETNVLDKKIMQMSPDQILQQLSGVFKLYDIVVVNKSTPKTADPVIKNWSSREAMPTDFELVFRLYGNIPGEVYLSKVFKAFIDRMERVRAYLTSDAVKVVTELQTYGGDVYEVKIVSFPNEDETVINPMRYAMFELDPDIPLVYYQKPSNAVALMELVYIHPDKTILIKAVDRVINALKNLQNHGR